VISVVTVTRNAAAHVGDCVRSLYGQDRYETVAEHLLIDALSSDETCRLVESLSGGRSRILSEKDQGLYDAMNKGVRLARGDVVGFLNADDVYAHPRVLATVAACFEADPSLQLCYSGLCYVRRDDLARVVRRWPAPRIGPRELAMGVVPPHPTVFMKRELFLRLDGFDLSYRIAADSDLLLRALDASEGKHLSVDDCWILMREGGVSNRSWKNVHQASVELRRSLRAAGRRNIPWLLAMRYLSKLVQYLPGRSPGK